MLWLIVHSLNFQSVYIPIWSQCCLHLSVMGVPWDFHSRRRGSFRNCSVISVSILAPLLSLARTISLTCIIQIQLQYMDHNQCDLAFLTRAYEEQNCWWISVHTYIKYIVWLTLYTEGNKRRIHLWRNVQHIHQLVLSPTSHHMTNLFMRLNATTTLRNNTFVNMK